MNNSKTGVGLFTLSTVALILPFTAQAYEGPYAGIKGGYSQADDQTFDYAGTHTTTPQAPIIVEQPAIQNDGIAAEYEYKSAIAYSLVLGWAFSNGLRPEFELTQRKDSADSIINSSGGEEDASGSDLSNTTGMMNLWYDVFPSWTIHPYVGAGVGFLRTKLDQFQSDVLTDFQTGLVRQADDTVLAYQLGAGIAWDIFDQISLGLDYRFLTADEGKYYPYQDQTKTHVDADYKAQTLFLSANYYFRVPKEKAPEPAPKPAAVVEPAPPPPDSDRDGVIDKFDQCPSTPSGTEVDDVGCALPPPPPPCKTPEPGERVSLGGCGTGDTITLSGVNFEFNKSTLTPNAKTILDNVAAELNKYPEIEVELAGHTDSLGRDAYNQNLSESRADSVKRYLVSMGVDGERMAAVGYGEAQPVADNDSDEGRARNRRTELWITAGVAEVQPSPRSPGDRSAPRSAQPQTKQDSVNVEKDDSNQQSVEESPEDSENLDFLDF